jgi:pyruvate/2-oxoacid:ferredoxin oxidoreductase beta subunit
MNGDQTGNEILRALGSQESSITSLTKAVDKFGEKLDDAITTCHEFEAYKESRKTIEPRLDAVEKNYDTMKTAFKTTMAIAGIAYGVVIAILGLIIWLFRNGLLKA